MWSNSFGTLHRVPLRPAAYFGLIKVSAQSHLESDVFEPVESRQQAKCARCRLKGSPDA